MQGAKVWGARPETTLKTIPTNLTFSHTQLVHRSHQATSSRWTPGNALVVHRLSSSLAFQRAAGSLVPRCAEGVEVMNRPALCQDKCSYHRYFFKIYMYICICVYINMYILAVCILQYAFLKKTCPVQVYNRLVGWIKLLPWLLTHSTSSDPWELHKFSSNHLSPPRRTLSTCFTL